MASRGSPQTRQSSGKTREKRAREVVRTTKGPIFAIAARLLLEKTHLRRIPIVAENRAGRSLSGKSGKSGKSMPAGSEPVSLTHQPRSPKPEMAAVQYSAELPYARSPCDYSDAGRRPAGGAGDTGPGCPGLHHSALQGPAEEGREPAVLGDTRAGRAAVKSKLESLREELGIATHEVNPAGTSLECSGCGFIDKRNRRGPRFTCGFCGRSLGSDTNAARVISRRRSSGAADCGVGPRKVLQRADRRFETA